MKPSVEVVVQHGSVADLHARDPFVDGPSPAQVWWCVPSDAAVVLGSRQTTDLLDAQACRMAGLSIARRRSGGGAVIIRPGSIVWVDLIVPVGAVSADVRASMVAAGEIWRSALVGELATTTSGEIPSLGVHRGGMVESSWSDLVCFAGLGPGEVTVAEPGAPSRKLVGLSQRRGRFGARVQGMVYARPLTRELPSLLAVDAPPLDELVEPAAAPGVEAGSVARRIAAELASRL